jgi:hypothetical protein
MEQQSVRFAPFRAAERPPALPSLAHCGRLLGKHGVIQFTRGPVPDLDSGYCLDDNARALLVAVAYGRYGLGDPIALRMGSAALQFFADASREAPCYHNVMDRYGAFTDECASPESVGRLIWALGVTATCAFEESWRATAWHQLAAISHAVGALTTLHARSYAMLGLAVIVDPAQSSPVQPVPNRVPDGDVVKWAGETLYAMAAAMRFEFLRNAQPGWMWWEPELTYDVARPPEAMLRAALALREHSFAETGLAAAEFVTGITLPSNTFVPIGAPRWCRRNGVRPMYDQQPLEAAAMVDMFLAASRLTGSESFRRQASTAYEWYLGNNVAGVALADVGAGSCHDGITPDGLNPNMGAESTLAYLQASLFLAADDQLSVARARRSANRKRASTTIASADAPKLPATIIED